MTVKSKRSKQSLRNGPSKINEKCEVMEQLHNREHRWRHAQHPSTVFIKHFVLTSYRWFYQWMLEMALFSLPIFQNCWCIGNQDNFTFVSLTLFLLLLPLPWVLQCRQAALGRQKWVISPQIAFVTSQFIMTMFNEWGTLQGILEHGKWKYASFPVTTLH